MSASEARNNATAPIVRFADVIKSYDGRQIVVNRLNLDVRPGEFLTLLGPSGSGKTTSLMMLAGFESPTEGAIYLRGRDVSRIPSYDRNIGMVFQSYALFPHMSVGENVGFPLTVRKRPRHEIETRVAAVLEMVNLGGLAQRKPAELSGGQQQRVALARALVFEPELVLLDEPLGALDRQLREHLQLELRRIHGLLGVTMIYVTHDQQEALTMSDRIAVFERGNLVQVATPEEVYRRPRTLFVARFFGENNAIAGTLEAATANGGEIAVHAAGGERLRACMDGSASAGQAVTLTVRPEAIDLSRQSPTAGLNALPVRLEERIFLGDSVVSRVVTRAGLRLSVRTPIRLWATGIEVGDEVFACWQPTDCLAFPEEGAA